MEPDEMMFFELIASSLISDLNEIVSTNRKMQVATENIEVRRDLFKCILKLSDKNDLSSIEQKYVSLLNIK